MGTGHSISSLSTAIEDINLEIDKQRSEELSTTLTQNDCILSMFPSSEDVVELRSDKRKLLAKAYLTIDLMKSTKLSEEMKSKIMPLIRESLFLSLDVKSQESIVKNKIVFTDTFIISSLVETYENYLKTENKIVSSTSSSSAPRRLKPSDCYDVTSNLASHSTSRSSHKKK